ncbi:MAG: twin-arginine translocase subunit TatB [Rhodospirillales bacterium]|jgi:sec-independent protein translocase protein TatB|nr:twin-arginine translocase subunit TatB [Rhodospirillales bacterium]
MLDIGWQELMVVAILAIIVIGPKDLPRALRTVMQGIRKVRGIAKEFQSGVDDMVKEADLDDLRQELNKVADGDIKKTITDAVDPNGDLSKEMDMSDVQKDMDKIAKDASADKPTVTPETFTESAPVETKQEDTKPDNTSTETTAESERPAEAEKPAATASNS